MTNVFKLSGTEHSLNSDKSFSWSAHCKYAFWSNLLYLLEISPTCHPRHIFTAVLNPWNNNPSWRRLLRRNASRVTHYIQLQSLHLSAHSYSYTLHFSPSLQHMVHVHKHIYSRPVYIFYPSVLNILFANRISLINTNVGPITHTYYRIKSKKILEIVCTRRQSSFL